MRGLVPGAARGVVAAMAMTAVRNVTAGFGLIERTPPDRVQRQPWIGPAYGVALWAGFEVVLGRLFELSQPRRKPYERLAVAADHALYGIIVAARPGRPA